MKIFIFELFCIVIILFLPIINRMNIVKSIIFGAPGSGKGTISEKIVRNFLIKHVSTGDILRYHIANKTKLGEKVNSYVSSGKLVPDEVMNELVEDELKSHNDSWLLDGYPRTLAQAEELSKHVDVNLVINLDVPFDVIVDRLKSRWIHKGSGRIYNIGFNNPKVPGLDDVTGEELVQREDDKPAVVLKRLNTYADNAKPIIEFYKCKNVLTTFTGNTSDEIWENLHPFLSERLSQK